MTELGYLSHVSTRMRYLITALIVLSACLAQGCRSSRSPTDPGAPPKELREALTDSGLACFQAPAKVTLLSLHPRLRSLDPDWWDEHAPGAEVFHDYAIVGSADLDATRRDRAFALVYGGIDASDGSVAACFNPRHGLRVERDGHRVDLVICYECLSMKVHETGETSGSVLTAEYPKSGLDAILRELGVARANR